MDNISVFDRLKEYGADADGARERFVDDEELYRDCLYSMQFEKSFDDLGEAISDGEHTKAFNAAHTLKGVVGNLGLTPFYQSITKLVEILRSGKYDEAPDAYAEVITEKARLDELIAVVKDDNQ